ncbi:MAG: hypothetical protein M3Y25_07145 [Thermoproteota archaeon]|nr:hypothetical protein [Thermoproteota archaeon]
MNVNEIYHYFANTQKTITLSNPKSITILIPAFTIFLYFTLITANTQTFSNVDASVTLGQAIEQFQNNIQSTVNEEIQSALQSSNISSDCDGNDNISIQSQTNNNGKTSSTVLRSCDNSTFDSFSPVSDLTNTSGKIVSSEYDLQTGVITNSLFGNWSLTTINNSKIFNAEFIKQPIFYDNSSVMSTGINTITNNTDPNNIKRNANNATIYNLSNFVVNSIQQQNEDIKYSGKIDLVRKEDSTDTDQASESTSFNNIDVSISIINNKTLTIHFDNRQSILYDEFKNVPIVGIVR